MTNTNPIATSAAIPAIAVKCKFNNQNHIQYASYPSNSLSYNSLILPLPSVLLFLFPELDVPNVGGSPSDVMSKESTVFDTFPTT